MTGPALTRYATWVDHARTRPFRHAFRYRTPLWLADVDRVPTAPRGLRWLGSVSAKDHWDGTVSLREGLDRFLAERGRSAPHRAVLLTGARSLGYCFNPISVYWCYDERDVLQEVVAEVHNTYRGRHAYLLDLDSAGRTTVPKQFYVSPFFDTAGEYLMRFSEPGDTVSVRIVLRREGVTAYTAGVRGVARSTGRLALFSRPWAQLRVAALIRWHGIRLWLRRLPVAPRGTATGNLQDQG